MRFAAVFVAVTLVQPRSQGPFSRTLGTRLDKCHTPRQNALRMSTTLSFRLIRISGCVLKSNINRKKSRTAKFENKKSKLACEGRRKISLVAKFILCLIFKCLHPRVSCLHPQRKMSEFRARWRSARANFISLSSPCCVGFVVRFCRSKMWESQQNQP